MRYIISLCIVILFTTAFTSCTKVIDIDLDRVAKKYVIDGTITNQPGGCKVLISQTKNFDEDNNFPGLAGAAISITENNSGTKTTLIETSAGVYQAPLLVGIPGKTYTLKVSIGAELFTASCAMPQPVNMDTIYVTNDNLFGEIWKLANIEFQDPAGIPNQYRFTQYINGVKTKQIFINNDDITDGRKFTTKLYFEPDTDDANKIKNNDVVKIEMMCIDAAIFKYWFSVEQGALGESESATPANPVTNIEGGALGYFSAHTSQTKTMVVP